jgi:YVTN family beta-propeller protein
VAVSAGNAQTGPAGGLLPAPIAAKVTDAHGRGVPNIPVLFSVVDGGGSVVGTPTPTNGAGIATATWEVGTIVGVEQRAVATLLDTLTGALLDTAVFTASVSAGPAAFIFPIFGDNIVAGRGQPIPVPLRAGVQDAYGNPAGGVVVTWQLISGPATLASQSATSNPQGIVANSVIPGSTDGDVEVRASLPGRQPAIFHIYVRDVSPRAGYLSHGGFGIARVPNGQFIVSLIHAGGVERVSAMNPEQSAVVTVGGIPVVTAVDHAGQFAYAANMGTGAVSVIDVASMNKVADIDVSGEAHSLAMAPRGDRVYVTNTSNSVFAVNVTTRAIVSTTTVPSGPWGIAFWTTATDSLMYVTSRDGGAISEIDMRTGSVTRTLPVTGRPHGIAIAPDGSTLYVCDDSGGEVQFVNRATGAIAQRISVPTAFGIAISPDGNTLYVTTNTGYIVVIDVPSATISKQVSTGGQPRQILVTSDGNTSYAANLGGWIDAVTR